MGTGRRVRSLIDREPRPMATMPGLDELADAERLDDLEEAGELVGVAGDLDR